jgi:membrane protein YqaA with SNARE-associated domain
MWKWLTVIGLAAAPALIFGQSAAWGAGIGFHLPVLLLGIVIALAGFAEGLVIVWLAAVAHRIPRLHRWLSKLHAPRFDRWFKRWGVWTGLLVGTAIAGQEPVIIALVWLDAPPKKLILPLAVANALYTVIYYLIVLAGIAGWDALMNKLAG